MVGPELVDGCQECVFPHATEPSVTLVSDHKFTYDHVYHGASAAGVPTEKQLYDECVEPLVTGLLAGYNATVLAYGQTGSGKTHTMGTAYQPGGATEGVIPRVMSTLFAGVAAVPEGTSISLKVGFIEIHKEDIRDLLAGGGETTVAIRDKPGGGVALVGVKEIIVATVEEMAAALASGSQARATAATGMNHRSSRSHAIFTIHVERRGADPADVTRAKMHLVDLAGSERAKRTKAEGQRLKEGIQINKGLLALGNVISALGDDKRRNAGGHVPYRDSKLTRLLQDSLGGNSRTVMVACISPADANLDETLNTLKYANRARNITNKPILNMTENASEEVAKLRRMLSSARAELQQLRLTGGGASSTGTGGASASSASGADNDKLDAMEARAMMAEAEAARLRADLAAAEEAAKASAAAEVAACVERDRLAVKLEDAGLSTKDDEGGTSVIRAYLSTIQALRCEQSRLKHQLSAARSGQSDPYAEDPAASYDLDDEETADADFGEDPEDIDDEDEPAIDFEEDLENDELQAELASVERSLQAKEARMRAMSSAAQKLQAEVDCAAGSAGGNGGVSGQQDMEELREKYGRLLRSLESEKSELAAERDRLLAALADAAKQGDDVRKEVEAKNRSRLLELEKRLKEVQRLAAKHQEAARLRAKSDRAAVALQADIQRLRAARVELVRRMERTARDGIARQRDAERALQAARKDGRRHAAAAQKAQAAVDRQAAVLRRKTEEASRAREQLRALQAAARANLRKKPVASAAAPAAAAAPVTSEAEKAGPGTGLGLGGRKAWLEAELAGAVERAELRAALEESLAQRAALGRRFPHLATPGKQSTPARTPGPPAAAWGVEEKTPGTGGEHGDDMAVEEEIRAVSEQIAMLQERVVQSEEREEVRGGMRRWARVRSLGEARSLLTMLFTFAAAARRKVNEVEGVSAGGPSLVLPNAAEASLPAVAATPGGNVLAEADAVLMQLQTFKASTASRQPKKRVRPPWQAVGPTSLVPQADDAKDEVNEKKMEAESKKAFGRNVDDLEEEDIESSESESDEEDEMGSDDPEWNEDCQTPAVIGGRTRRATAVSKATVGQVAMKKGPACTVCTQMFDKRVEGHQKSHKRCPFFSLYVMEKEIKQLEEQGQGAEEELKAKRAEHKSELCRLRRAAQEGVICAPCSAAEKVASPDDAGPESHPVSAPNSASSSDSMTSFEEPTSASSGGYISVTTPHTTAAKVEVPLSELITTCRNARRRAEGLLHASGGGLMTGSTTERKQRSPFGDVSNDSFPGSAAATAAVRKRMSFGAPGFGATAAFQAPCVTSHRGSFGGESEVGLAEEEMGFGTVNLEDL